MKTLEMNAVDAAYDTVARHAERICNDDAHDLGMMEPGDWWAQGDIRVDRLPDNWLTKNGVKANVERQAWPLIQLVPGTTQGSRHCLDSLEGVTVYRLRNATPLDGPLLEFSEPRSILHPEHGDVTNLPPGCYAIRFQRAMADELRAVAD